MYGFYLQDQQPCNVVAAFLSTGESSTSDETGIWTIHGGNAYSSVWNM